jgi:hypothetical protein
MKFIFSYINLKNKQPNLNLAKVSNFLIQNQGFETFFFGDESSLNFLKTVPFNKKFEIKKEEVENLPKCIWSSSKFIAMSKMTEPFIHVDFDFLFFKIQKSLLDQNIVCLHSEMNHDQLIISLQKSMQIRPKEILNIKQISYNCAIIGGVNFNILKRISLYLLKYLSDNKLFIDKMYSDSLHKKNKKNISIIPVLVEQVWMFQLFKFYKEEFKTYIESDLHDQNFQIEAVEKGFLHFQEADRLESVNKTLQEFVKNFKIN